MSKHLILPDFHASPHTDNDRADWFGKMLLDVKPDVVVCLGDFADMPSLFKKRYGANEEKYWEDIKATQDAMYRMLRPLKEHNQKLKSWKKKPYKPRLVMCLGNHEQRIVNCKGGPSVDHLPYKAWEVYPYREPVEIDGVTYAHSVISGVMARDIGGENPAVKVLSTAHTSTTVGHSHLLDFSVQTTLSGKKIYGLVAGCYDDHDHDYAGPANKLWWRGAVVKHNVSGGTYDPEFIQMSTIKNRYGSNEERYGVS